MLIKYTVVILIFSLLFFGCKNRNKEISNDFTTYLKKDLNLKKKKNHLYVAFSNRSCHACVNKVLQKINKHASEDNTTIMLSGYSKKDFNYLTEKLEVKTNLVYDLEETKFSIKYLTTSKTIIYYFKNKKSVLKQFDYSDIEDALLIIENFYINEN